MKISRKICATGAQASAAVSEMTSANTKSARKISVSSSAASLTTRLTLLPDAGSFSRHGQRRVTLPSVFSREAPGEEQKHEGAASRRQQVHDAQLQQVDGEDLADVLP